MAPCDLPVVDFVAEIVALDSAGCLIRKHADRNGVSVDFEARHDIPSGQLVSRDHLVVTGSVARRRMVPEPPHRWPIMPVDGREKLLDHHTRSRDNGWRI